MKNFCFLLLGIIIALGCARVRVEAPKEAIKLDISMRLDIYQHVQKDIDAIESIVSGKGNHSLLNYFLSSAYAQEGLSPEVEQAALRRKDRRSELLSLEVGRVIGENKEGLIEIRDTSSATTQAQQLVNAENNDRLVIYQTVAVKNNTSVEEIKKLYAKRLQNDAPEGTPIEVLNESSGAYEWKAK